MRVMTWCGVVVVLVLFLAVAVASNWFTRRPRIPWPRISRGVPLYWELAIREAPEGLGLVVQLASPAASGDTPRHIRDQGRILQDVLRRYRGRRIWCVEFYAPGQAPGRDDPRQSFMLGDPGPPDEHWQVVP